MNDDPAHRWIQDGRGADDHDRRRADRLQLGAGRHKRRTDCPRPLLSIPTASGSPTDLHDVDLSRVDLTGVDLPDGDLTGVDLTGANLSDADLSEADLTDADVTDADLNGADFCGARFCGAILPQGTSAAAAERRGPQARPDRKWSICR